MDDPLQEIGSVVHKLCQGAPDEQKTALETYFTEDAAFFHPFCRVDSAPGSRNQLLSVFQWYKIMSPKIELDIQSIGESAQAQAFSLLTYTAYDEIKQILYVTIHQVFSIWFLLGLHNADVVLTTKLQLVKRNKKYYVQSQNDLYQVDQFMKFITIPRGIGAYAVIVWQWVATFNCVLLAYIFSFVTSAEQWYSDQGKKQIQAVREKSVYQIADEARETLLSAADQTKQSIASRTNGQTKSSGNQQFGNLQVVDTK